LKRLLPDTFSLSNIPSAAALGGSGGFAARRDDRSGRAQRAANHSADTATMKLLLEDIGHGAVAGRPKHPVTKHEKHS
jgi:hypothetical protein